MSEDYKKIALEDVKVGQRVRIVDHYRSHIAMCEGVVAGVDPEFNEIELGEAESGFTTCIDPEYGTDIFLLEDAPKPKVVRTETVTITHYDDGTKTETPVNEEVKVPMVIETMEQFEEYEEYLKKTVLRDKDGDYWRHTSASEGTRLTYGDIWLGKTKNVTESCLPMTIVSNVGD